MTSDLDDEAQFLLGNLIETHLPVPEAELDRYRRLMSRKEYRKVQDVELTWADKVRLEGVKEGGREDFRRDCSGGSGRP